MEKYIIDIEELWQLREELGPQSRHYNDALKVVNEVIAKLSSGDLAVCEKRDNTWQVNEYLKKAILLHFKISNMTLYDSNCMQWHDKIDLKFTPQNTNDLILSDIRLVPGAIVREGVYIGKNSVVMPSFINIGAYVGSRTLIDTWSTIGSCAYIGQNCHISGGVGIGGVLEPLQAKPVIIENNCFIGARSEVVEGVIIGEGSVLGMGVFIGASTKIVNRATGEIFFGQVPPYSVVVPGCLPSTKPNLPGLYCVVIVKTVDEKTRSKTAINELLRN